MSGAKLGRKKANREALLRNQMRSLFTYGFLTTTTPKAKAVKGIAESFLSKIKKDSLETKRAMHLVLGRNDLVEKATKFSQGGGNAVGIVKVGFRDGDNAETSKVFLIGDTSLFEQKKTKKKNVKDRSQKKGRTEFVEEKKDDKTLDKGKIVDKVINKERAKSRSGI